MLDSIESTVQENRLSAELEEEYMYLEDYERRWQEEGALRTYYGLVERGHLTPEVAAGDAGMSVADFLKEMEKAGYKVPQNV